MRHVGRRGFSLLEVMLATTVLLGGVIVLSHIAFVGTAHMDAAEQYATAQLVCQSRMNEMLAGAAPLEEVRNQLIGELPGWGLTVRVKSAGQPGLLALEVTASQSTARMTTGGNEATPAGKRFTLIRWIAEPPGAETASRMPTSPTGGPLLDLPGESLLPDASLLPEEPFMPEESLFPEEPPLPDESSLFDEPPLPEF